MNGEVNSEEGRAGGQQEQHAQLAAAAVAVTHILAFLRAGALLPRPRHVSVGVQLGGRQHVQAGVHRQPAAGGLGKGQAAGGARGRQGAASRPLTRMSRARPGSIFRRSLLIKSAAAHPQCKKGQSCKGPC